MIQNKFLEQLTPKAKKNFSTKREFCMSVYNYWLENGKITDKQMDFLEMGLRNNSKNISYYGIRGAK